MGRELTYYVSRPFLGSPLMLWSLFWINLLGTIYGYMWYGNQLVYTAQEMSPLYLPFVPDSPTASLFFTIFIVCLLMDRKRASSGAIEAPRQIGVVRGFIEAFGLITSFKYGVWAVSMIVSAAYQGDALVWQDWMLIGSHLGMAVEALLYFAFYRFGFVAITLVAAWVLWNDYMDYAVGVYPWLPEALLDDLQAVASYTVALSVSGIVIAVLYRIVRAWLPGEIKSV